MPWKQESHKQRNIVECRVKGHEYLYLFFSHHCGFLLFYLILLNSPANNSRIYFNVFLKLWSPNSGMLRVEEILITFTKGINQWEAVMYRHTCEYAWGKWRTDTFQFMRKPQELFPIKWNFIIIHKINFFFPPLLKQIWQRDFFILGICFTNCLFLFFNV